MEVIEDYPGYFINEEGEIYSHQVHVGNPDGELRKLNPWLNNEGYCYVNLHVSGKRSSKRVHRLVAEAFIPNPENKRTVNHKNGIKTDCRVVNLEWNTYSENEKHAYATGLKNSEKVNRPVEQLDLNGNFICQFKSTIEAERKTGILYQSIGQVALGRLKTAGKYKWRYV